MKAVIQRVIKSSVEVNGEKINEIKEGLCVLIGFETGDTEEKIDKMIKKTINMRLFGDKFSKSVLDINGEILLIPNFTIPAITKKGTRPNFQNSMPPNEAKKFYDLMLDKLNRYIIAKAGVFGADMKVEIINDGPVTIILEV